MGMRDSLTYNLFCVLKGSGIKVGTQHTNILQKIKLNETRLNGSFIFFILFFQVDVFGNCLNKMHGKIKW